MHFLCSCLVMAIIVPSPPISNKRLLPLNTETIEAALCAWVHGLGDYTPIPNGHAYAAGDCLHIYLEASYPIRKYEIKMRVFDSKQVEVATFECWRLPEEQLQRSKCPRHWHYMWGVPALEPGSYTMTVVSIGEESTFTTVAPLRFDIADPETVRVRRRVAEKKANKREWLTSRRGAVV